MKLRIARKVLLKSNRRYYRRQTIDAAYQRLLKCSRTFVYDPSAIAGGDVYTDWARLMRDVGATRGLRRIEIPQDCAIPPGTYDLRFVELCGRPRSRKELRCE